MSLGPIERRRMRPWGLAAQVELRQGDASLDLSIGALQKPSRPLLHAARVREALALRPTIAERRKRAKLFGFVCRQRAIGSCAALGRHRRQLLHAPRNDQRLRCRLGVCAAPSPAAEQRQSESGGSRLRANTCHDKTNMKSTGLMGGEMDGEMNPRIAHPSPSTNSSLLVYKHAPALIPPHLPRLSILPSMLC